MSKDNDFPGWHGTTIVAVRRGSKVVIAGDGQVSVGNTVMKHNAKKVRRLSGGKVIGGFAGATADNIRNKIKTMLQMAVVLTYGASLPVIKVGRMAGQFSKPRSRPGEVREGVEAV